MLLTKRIHRFIGTAIHFNLNWLTIDSIYFEACFEACERFYWNYFIATLVYLLFFLKEMCSVTPSSTKIQQAMICFHNNIASPTYDLVILPEGKHITASSIKCCVGFLWSLFLKNTYISFRKKSRNPSQDLERSVRLCSNGRSAWVVKPLWSGLVDQRKVGRVTGHNVIFEILEPPAFRKQEV